MKINFYINLKNRIKYNQKKAENVLKVAKQQLRINKKFELSVVVVGDKKIRTLNREYRNKDYVTDVLSFDQIDGFDLVSKDNNDLGEIFICYPQVIRQAKKFNQSIEQEFSTLLIHGFLHLLGYDHEKESDYKKIKKIEEKIFNKIYAKNK